MSTGHDKPCPRCKGAGEMMVKSIRRFAEPIAVDGVVTELLTEESIRIVECYLCTGTGLIESDDYWEGA